MAKRNVKDNGVQIPFLEQEFIDKWQEWLKYRKERKLANYVPTGLKMTFTKLLKDSGGDFNIAIQIIDQSISAGWQGLFPIKSVSNAAHFTNTANGNKQSGTSGTRIQAAKNF